MFKTTYTIYTLQPINNNLYFKLKKHPSQITIITDKNMEKDRRDHKSGLTYKEWKLVRESGINPYPNLLSEKEKRLLRTANKYHTNHKTEIERNNRSKKIIETQDEIIKTQDDKINQLEMKIKKLEKTIDDYDSINYGPESPSYDPINEEEQDYKDKTIAMELKYKNTNTQENTKSYIKCVPTTLLM